MGAHPAPARASDTRRRILRAAYELFAVRGFEGVTTATLAERAGVAEGTIYRYFTGMNALFQACVQGAATWLREQIQAAGGERKGVAAQLDRLAGTILDTAARQPALARMALMPPSDHVFDSASRTSRQHVMEALQQVIAAGKQEGWVRPGGADLWAPLWLHLIGHAVLRIASGEWERDHPGTWLVIESGTRLITSTPQPPPFPPPS